MMQRIAALLLALALCLSGAALGETTTEIRDAGEAICPGAVLEDGVLKLPEGLTRLGWLNEFDSDECVVVNGYNLVGEDREPPVKALRLPASLREIGKYGLCCLYLEEDLVIPEGVERLENMALQDVTAPRLVLPATVTLLENVGDWNAGGSFPFGEIVIAADNPAYCMVDGVLFTRDMTELVLYPGSLDATHYDVPAGVQVIHDRAFYGNDHLQTVSLPVGLRRIGRYAFGMCGRLTAVNIPLTVTEIRWGAFVECVSVGRVTLPPSLAYLLTYDPEQDMYPDAVFEGCLALNGDFQGDNGEGIAIQHSLWAEEEQFDCVLYEDDEETDMGEGVG